VLARSGLARLLLDLNFFVLVCLEIDRREGFSEPRKSGLRLFRKEGPAGEGGTNELPSPQACEKAGVQGC
jgi:hypothetical protein